MDDYIKKLEETNQKLEEEIVQLKELMKIKGTWQYKNNKPRLFAYKPNGYPVPTDINWPEAIQVRYNLSFTYRKPWPNFKLPRDPWKQRLTFLKYWLLHWYSGGASIHCNVEVHGYYFCILGLECHLSPWITSPANFNHEGAILANGMICQSKD